MNVNIFNLLDIIYCIMCQCPYKTIYRLSAVNTNTYTASNNQQLWKDKLSNFSIKLSTNNYKLEYKNFQITLAEIKKLLEDCKMIINNCK